MLCVNLNVNITRLVDEQWELYKVHHLAAISY